MNTFFLNEDYSGWANIARKLIETGSCITTENIWTGGIGNFIDCESCPEGINVVKLTFDVKAFCSKENLFFMDAYNYHMEKLKGRLEEVKYTYYEMESLV